MTATPDDTAPAATADAKALRAARRNLARAEGAMKFARDQARRLVNDAADAVDQARAELQVLTHHLSDGRDDDLPQDLDDDADQPAEPAEA